MSFLRQRVNRFLLRMGFPRDWALVPVAALIGTTAGLAAHGYGLLVRSSEEFFFGRIGGHGLQQTGSRLWWLVLALPMAGAGLVGLIKYALRLPLISHGIPEVIESLTRHGARMRLRSGLFTAVNSALTIGSGGSAGQEGPIVQIGSVLGSKVGHWLQAGRDHRSTLVGCGAAAGLAAIFNAPIAGVLLVLEVVLRDFSLRTFTPVVIAAVFGVTVKEAIPWGAAETGATSGALFSMVGRGARYHFSLAGIPPYLVLGALCGVVAWGFARTLTAVERRCKALAWPAAAKPVLGAAGLGLCGLLVLLLYPGSVPGYVPAFFGNGYPVMQTLLTPAAYDAGSGQQLLLGFLILIAAGKLVGTALTLGSGGTGGLFAPTLFIGAACGAAFGTVLQGLGLSNLSPAAFALAGMAGVLSGAIHCPLTAILLIFEITQDYGVVMPVMLVAIAATVTAQVLMRQSIYVQALEQMGLRVGGLADAAVWRRLTIAGLRLSPAVVVEPGQPAGRLVELSRQHPRGTFVVCDKNGRYLGLVADDDLHTALLQPEALPLMVVSEFILSEPPVLDPDETLESAMDKFARHSAESLAVVDAQSRVLGLLSRRRLLEEYQRALREPA